MNYLYIIERQCGNTAHYYQKPFIYWTTKLPKARFFTSIKEAQDHIEILPDAVDPADLQVRAILLTATNICYSSS